MRAILAVGLWASIVAVGALFAADKPPQKKIDIKLDEKSAVQIAEIVLVKVYGDRVRDEKPWKVAADDKSFTIEGTLPKGFVGGVALIRISRTNAEVLEITHGK